jgi:hypothetical protein
MLSHIASRYQHDCRVYGLILRYPSSFTHYTKYIIFPSHIYFHVALSRFVYSSSRPFHSVLLRAVRLHSNHTINLCTQQTGDINIKNLFSSTQHLLATHITHAHHAHTAATNIISRAHHTHTRLIHPIYQTHITLHHHHAALRFLALVAAQQHDLLLHAPPSRHARYQPHTRQPPESRRAEHHGAACYAEAERAQARVLAARGGVDEGGCTLWWQGGSDGRAPGSRRGGGGE